MMGREMYMNVSYVVEVYGYQRVIPLILEAMRRARQTHLATRQTFESIPVLTLEEVDNKTIVPLLVDLPFLLCRDLWR
jgi:hypothetical protein